MKAMKYQAFKRFLDFVLSLLAFCVLSPLLAAVSLAVKLDSKGPVVFRQKRIGKDKTHFEMLKFRTMRTDTPKDMPTHLLKNPDAFITKVGSFLRKTSLDELPQLWNILKGDMSFVGPRPLISSEIRAHRMRLEYGVYRFRPGLTGLAQIKGRDSISLMKKMKYDKLYCDNWSIKMDIAILLQSVGVCIRQEGFHEGIYHRR